jgi:hypothetical protein
VLQGGNELCRIEGFDRRKAVSELKVSIEAEAGLVPALTRMINPESLVELQDHVTLEDAGMPSEHTLAEGVIQLYVQKLKKVVVADELQIAPGEVTNSKLAVLCDSIRDNPPDILVLCGCCRVTNISCLVQLSTISHLDISGCNLGVTGGFHPLPHLAGVIKDMGALLHFDISDNNIRADGGKALVEALKGNQVITTLIIAKNDLSYSSAGKDMSGVAALADAIPGMGALTELDISKNEIGVDADGNVTPEGKTHDVLVDIHVVIFLMVMPSRAQVLLLLPMPSATTGRYRHCR